METPTRPQRPVAVPFSPIDTMEKMVKGDDDVSQQIDSAPILAMMKQGCFFNQYSLDSGKPVCQRIFMYYRNDSHLGSIYRAPASTDIAAPERSVSVPSSHAQLPLKRVTDIWLGKQTDALMHTIADRADGGQCWSIFATDTAKKPYSLDLEADSEEVLSEWLFGINTIMSSAGRLLTKNEEEEAAAVEAQTPAAPTPTPSTTVAPTPLKKKPTNQRRFSIQCIPQSKHNSQHNGELMALNSGGSIIMHAQMSSFKTKVRDAVQKEIASIKRQYDANNICIQQDMGKMRDAMENTVSAIMHKVSQDKASAQVTQTALVKALNLERETRKKLMNQLIEEHGNIRVFARVRPLLHFEQQETCVLVDDADNCDKQMTEQEELLAAINGSESCIEVLGNEASRGQNTPFQFDAVFGPNTSQANVSKEVVPFVRSCIDGYNVCIFAYGQTGSGKTYTMEGTPAQPGVNYRALTELFTRIEDLQATQLKAGAKVDFNVEVAVVEIYNETPRDLLYCGHDAAEHKLEIRGGDQGVHVPGLTRVKVDSVEDVREVLVNQAYPNRSVGRTNMNAQSSRSHCVLFVHVESFNNKTHETMTGKLVLIDLAGSERVDKSGVVGQALKEAQNINKSLSALGDVIQALQSKDKHIPYRNSKLTFLLQDCLGGNSKCLMFCNVSPASSNQNETLCSLRFASRARNTQLGKAKKNTGTSAGNKGSAEADAQLKAKDKRILSLENQIESLVGEVESMQHQQLTQRATVAEGKNKDKVITELQMRSEQQLKEINALKRQLTKTTSRMSSFGGRMSSAKRTSMLDDDEPTTTRRAKRKSFEMAQDDENVETVMTKPSYSRSYAVAKTPLKGGATGTLKRTTTTTSRSTSTVQSRMPLSSAKKPRPATAVSSSRTILATPAKTRLY